MGSLNIFDGSAWKPTGVIINNYNIPPFSVGLSELKPEVTAEALGGATPPVMLWENASPTSEFPPQTLNFDEDYDFYIAELAVTNANNNIRYSALLSTQVQSASNYVWIGNNALRAFRAAKRTIVVGDGYYFSEFGGKSTVANTYGIPIKIFGIKGAN